MEATCKKCGRPIYGSVAKVHTAETWEQKLPPEKWCEECRIAHGTCKCDGCGEEFTEEFRMPRISGGLYCVPCARDEVPDYFDDVSVFAGESAARFCGQLLKQEKEHLKNEIITPIFNFECDRCGKPTGFAEPDENGTFAGVCQTCGEKLCARCAGGWIDEVCERCRSGQTESP